MILEADALATAQRLELPVGFSRVANLLGLRDSGDVPKARGIAGGRVAEWPLETKGLLKTEFRGTFSWNIWRDSPLFSIDFRRFPRHFHGPNDLTQGYKRKAFRFSDIL